jgi:ABC-type transport system substrate-binding protein
VAGDRRAGNGAESEAEGEVGSAAAFAERSDGRDRRRGGVMRKSTLAALCLAVGLPAIGMDSEAATPAGTLTVVVPNFGRESLDRGLTSTVDLQFNGHHYDALIGTARNGELTADRGLAESWRMSPDARSITLRLRKNVRWHDGQPFTGDDVAFSFERFRAKDAVCTFCGQVKRTVKEVKVLDPHMVQIDLVEPDVTFPSVLGSRDGDIRIIARSNYRPKADGFELVGTPVGTGPWKFVEFKRGVEIRFEANPDYWDPKRIPEFAALRVVPRPEPSTRLSMVRTGEADLAVIDASQVPEAKAAGVRVLVIKAPTISLLTFMGSYHKETWGHRTEFRKAIVLAIDMKSIVKRIFPEGTGTQFASTFWTEPALGHDPALPLYPFDPAEARRILKEIGYDGKTVKIWSAPVATSPETPEIMELVQGYLNAAGLKTELTPMEFGAFRPRFARRPQAFDATFAAHLHINVPFTRPMLMQNLAVTWLSQEAGGLVMGYWNPPKIDAAFTRLRQITDLKVLEEELRKLNRETYAEYVSYPVIARNGTFAAGPRVGDWSPGDYGQAWHLETVKKGR